MTNLMIYEPRYRPGGPLANIRIDQTRRVRTAGDKRLLWRIRQHPKKAARLGLMVLGLYR